MLNSVPIFEIPAEALTNPPQDANKSNPKKLMIEEPLYIIFNTALSTSWGTVPPNAGRPCRGDGNDPVINRICSDFPMYLNIDYIRVWQDTKTMSVGCDPETHPTKQWIQGHLEEYQDADNQVIEVAGGATCKVDGDCTLGEISGTSVISGACDSNTKRCVCSAPKVWGGPRCTTIVASASASDTSSTSLSPSLGLVIGLASLALLLTLGIVYFRTRGRRLQLQFRMGKASAAAAAEGGVVAGAAASTEMEMSQMGNPNNKTHAENDLPQNGHDPRLV